MKWVLIIFIEWVLIIFIIFIIFVIFIIFHQVDINDNQLGSFCSEGESDQLTTSKTHASEETGPSISSNLRHIASFLDLHSVRPPRSLKCHSVSCQLVEFQPHIAWDDLCKKSKMTQCSNANTKSKIVVTFHLISYRRMTKT